MSFARPHVSLDALLGQARLPGPLLDVALRVPARADLGTTGSFRAQLLQHMMGELDRTSLAMNEAEGRANPASTKWDQSLALENHGFVHTPTVRRLVRRVSSGGPGIRRHQAVAPAFISPQAQPKAGGSVSRLVQATVTPGPKPESGPAQSTSLPMKAVAPASAADGFLRKLAGIARTTAETLGLSPHLLLAQAALETGWGRKAIKDGGGQESYNLFGIKADKHWTGKTIEVNTTEYVNGVPLNKVASFRAYDSYAESFSDYAALIKRRYGQAIAKGATAEGFGRALQAKGYATDPNYAQKIARVAQSVAYRLAPRSAGTSEMA